MVGPARLDEHTVGPGAQRPRCIRVSAFAAEHQNRDGCGFRITSQHTTEIQPVDARQPQARDDRVRPLRNRLGQRLAAILRFFGDAAVKPQEFRIHGPGALVALDEQDVERSLEAGKCTGWYGAGHAIDSVTYLTDW